MTTQIKTGAALLDLKAEGNKGEISGYGSTFGGEPDSYGDIIAQGAFSESLAAHKAAGTMPKMFWQHDPGEPIGVWDEVREDATGLWVKGRLLTDVAKGREAASLIAAKAIDGLSIGYRTLKARKDDHGKRLLTELELWEVSLVTFPMLPQARVGAKGDDRDAAEIRALAQAFDTARMAIRQS